MGQSDDFIHKAEIGKQFFFMARQLGSGFPTNS